ncbi:MAG TPA: DUF1223 domain-containing protein [Pyrinomonadaceae bacterium]|nr:DUF1223 domain-containing protein [Pyrinomonadaceae bacterium]
MNSVASREAVESTVVDESKTVKAPVLVELFTSEGCSSCPPADRALTLLQNQQPIAGAEIIALAFHVDYWDGPAWKDTYSSPLFTQRQEIYTRSLELDSSYTPQMVVDGRYEFVGSDLGKANKTVEKAEKTAKGIVELSTKDSKLNVSITGIPDHNDATVYLAIAESGLSSNVAGGENQGHKLEHSSVVRELNPVGMITKSQNEFKSSVSFDLKSEYKTDQVSLVVFVQENGSRGIVAVGKIAAQ